MTSHELEQQYVRMLDMLRKELGSRAGPEAVEAVGRKHFERLHSHATVFDFIPLLAYRATKDELIRATQTHQTQRHAGQAELRSAA